MARDVCHSTLLFLLIQTVYVPSNGTNVCANGGLPKSRVFGGSHNPPPFHHFSTPCHGTYAVRLDEIGSFERYTSRPTGRAFAPMVTDESHVFLGQTTRHHSITSPPHGTGRTPFDSLKSVDSNGIRPVQRDGRLRQRWPAKITCFFVIIQPATIPSFFHPVARDVRR